LDAADFAAWVGFLVRAGLVLRLFEVLAVALFVAFGAVVRLVLDRVAGEAVERRVGGR
jgi:nitrate reductase NapE component